MNITKKYYLNYEKQIKMIQQREEISFWTGKNVDSKLNAEVFHITNYYLPMDTLSYPLRRKHLNHQKNMFKHHFLKSETMVSTKKLQLKSY